MAYEVPMCVHCEERPAVDEHGCCVRCHWKIEAEVDEGWLALGSYLSKWAAFSDWETLGARGGLGAVSAGLR